MGKISLVFFILLGNLLLSSPLYEFIMEAFDIDTGGFINFNPIFMAGLSWMIIAFFGIVFARIYKRQLQEYYKTILVTELIALGLPLFILIVVVFILFVSKATNH